MLPPCPESPPPPPPRPPAATHPLTHAGVLLPRHQVHMSHQAALPLLHGMFQLLARGVPPRPPLLQDVAAPGVQRDALCGWAGGRGWS